jgi:hypothetical protein
LRERRASGGSPFAALADGVGVRLRLTPRARRSGVDGLSPDADGGTALKVSVTAPPEDGKANAELIALLAAEWGLAKSAISLKSGAASRHKAVHVKGDPASLLGLLDAWLKRLKEST